MELRQLRSFLALAKELHFQRAAREVGITQPTLSVQLKNLEEELGVTLIARDRRKVALTEPGNLLHQRLEPLVQSLDSAIKEAKEVSQQSPVTLRMAYADYLNLPIITNSLMAAQTAHPRLTIDRVEVATNEVEDALKENRIDIGFGPLPATHPSTISKRVADGHWVIVLPESHPLAQHETLPLSKLENEPLVFFDRNLNPNLFDNCLATFTEAGLNVRIVLQTRQVLTALQTVSSGTALYLVASYIVSDLPNGLVSRDLSGFDNRIAVGAFWHEDNSSIALTYFLESLRSKLSR